MPQETVIRDATPADAVAMARIHLIARGMAMPWLAKVHGDDETEAWMATEVIPRQRVRVATVGGVPVGFAAFGADWLEQLYIHPEHQNAGIGSCLFNEVCAMARSPFRFWVFQRNVAARRFYERHGSRLIKLTEGGENEEREPDALYEKAVPRL
jgi:GNAT superfamily N-acetyltransferase